MRYSLALGALCAAGALANNVDKRSYVTDWTVVTLTTTITEYPTPTVYENVAAQEATAAASSSSAAAAAAAAESSSSAAAAAAAAASASAEASSSAAAAAAAAAEASTSSVVTPVEVATSWTSAWTSAWTSSWSSTVAPSTTLATSTSSSASSTATSAYQSAVLYNHNVHRSNHSASSVEWSSDLESSAYTLAAKCVYEHDTSIDGGGYGQNIGYGVEASEIGVMITNLMYNDEMGYYTDLYGEADPDMTYFDNWGHFSQIVWAATTHVGCATVTCDSLGNVDASEALPFTVCNYSPAGNYEGEYATNVKRPLGQSVYVAS
ncbi:SCP-like extracellular protein [Aspergillus costaricaensis CBS 115574]|uniref:SCP-like extracellular protein n=1 Tax=Aspergillus costaricaensis CBS 115574 TaxID=1448317 RepID=A0ACD1I6N7_9EURO|nr:SCP-like extracellular protein [Aspergillus costaricaensis CBS 115574]RAK85923.1 SCP-like extracellular protein [Aspergillus costaricaensis CBS 115574]